MSYTEIDSKVTFDHEKVIAAKLEKNREIAIKGLIQVVKNILMIWLQITVICVAINKNKDMN